MDHCVLHRADQQARTAFRLDANERCRAQTRRCARAPACARRACRGSQSYHKPSPRNRLVA
eukprot:9368320-Alexandrium_andersonii.AAC.1